MSWYLRSVRDQDTHRAEGVNLDGTVTAVCGARFVPRVYLSTGQQALPDRPPDPDQICPECDS